MGIVPSRPPILYPDKQDWKCIYCGEINDSENKNCEYCGANKIIKGE